MDPSWAYGARVTTPVDRAAVQGGPVHLGPTSPAVAGLLLTAALLILLMKIAGFRAMVAVGRS